MEALKMRQKEANNFFLKIEYIPMHKDELLNAKRDPHVTIVGNKEGLKYLVDKISDYLESSDCDYDNLNFDIGPDLSEGPIDMDIVCDEECKFQKK